MTALRDLVARCEALADALDVDPDSDPAPLVHELAQLRMAFAAYNAERVVRPIRACGTVGSRGSVRDVLGTLRAQLPANVS